MTDARKSLASRAGAIAGAPRTRRILGWLAALVAAFAIAGFFVVPPIAKSKLEAGLSQFLHRRVTVDAVSVNPFTPSVALRGFNVREREGEASFAAFDELYVNVAWTSLFRLAPVVDELRLSGPRLRIVRNADGSYNFQDLLDEFLARPAGDGPTPAFALFNIQVLDGSVDFDDRAEDARHALTELRLGIPFVSSLAAHREVRVLPELSAKLNGSALGVQGDTLPFADTHLASVNLHLDGFDLTRLVPYLPFEPRAKLRAALLDARLALQFQQAPGKAPQVLLRGGAALRDLALVDLQDRPMLAWKRLAVEVAELEPLLPRVALQSVVLDGTDVHLRRDKTGMFNLQRAGNALAEWRAQRRTAQAEAGAAAVVPIQIEKLALNAGRIRFTDEAIAPTFETVAEELQLDVTGLDSAPGKEAEWRLAVRTAAGETVKAGVRSTAFPPTGNGRVEVAGIQLKRYQPYIGRVVQMTLDDGRLDAEVSGQWSFDATLKDRRVKLTEGGVRLKNLRARLPGERQPFVRLGSLAVEGAAADLEGRSLDLGKIAVRDLAARLRREKDGSIDVAQILAPARTGGTRDATPSKAGSAATAWRVDLGELSLDQGSLALEDRAVGAPLTHELSAIQVKARKFSTTPGQRGSLSLKATVNKTGSVALSGPLSLDPPVGDLNITAKTLGVVPAQRYLGDRLNIDITSGALSANGRASFALSANGTLRAAYKGDLSVTDFASVDRRLAQDLLKWKALSLGAIDVALDPLKVSLDEIALADFYARVILSPEGRLNLQDLVAKPGEAAAPDATAAASAPAVAGAAAQPIAAQREAAPAAPAAPARPSNIRIGKITLQGGNVNLSDFFIKPNYSANLTGVAGLVTEMHADKAGNVELRGKIDNAAPVEVLGSVNPLAKDLFLDLKASARDVELPPLSPYAVKYAGYGIARGKLSMNVKYHLESRKLAAENNIYLDQLTFGEKVESPTATQLPVTLAVALLKDRNGVIDINLPISGSLDDPQFSLGGIIVKVIVNLIVKAITAPFALIGSLFGGGEEMAYLEFAPGLATLGEGAPGKLQNLAKALTERPGLRLDVAGRADPATDREGLKRVALERAVRAQKFNALRRAGETPASADAVKVEAAEYEKFLKGAYGEAKFAKPRNAVGLTKDLPAAEMESLLLANTPVDEDGLRLLANARAQAAKEWLTGEGKVPAERIFIVAPRLTTDDIKDKGGPARVDFALK